MATINLGRVKGDRGLQGIRGEKGDTGPIGIQGLKGETGDRGLTGFKGDKGDIGPQGPRGYNGSDANVTSNNINSALGFIPMAKKGGTLESYTEKTVIVSASNGIIDLNDGNTFVHSPQYSSVSYAFLNPKGGVAHSFTLQIWVTTAKTITFPSSVKWQGGKIPDLTDAYKTYVLTFMTTDGGKIWLGMFGGVF